MQRSSLVCDELSDLINRRSTQLLIFDQLAHFQPNLRFFSIPPLRENHTAILQHFACAEESIENRNRKKKKNKRKKRKGTKSEVNYRISHIKIFETVFLTRDL